MGNLIDGLLEVTIGAKDQLRCCHRVSERKENLPERGIVELLLEQAKFRIVIAFPAT